MPSPLSSSGVFMEMITLCQSEDAARLYLIQKGILRSTTQCSACNHPMILRRCSATKSADEWIFKCGGAGCKRTKSIRSGSYLESSHIPFVTFLMLLYCFASKNLTAVDISAYTGLSRESVNKWRGIVMDAVTIWLYNNPQAIGGPGLIVELDEAMFGKRKYNRGALREGVWVLRGVCRSTGHCFLVNRFHPTINA